MARRNRVDPLLLAASKRKQPEDRPKCPTCGLRAPHYRDPEGGASWFQTFGHRCPHGEPCPGWHDPGEFVETCYACKAVPIRKEQTDG